METVRGLLAQGNSKLGEAIHVWSLPAITTCPGATVTCKRVCYARKSRYLFDAVQERLKWNLEQAMRDDFVDRMVMEIRRKGCLVVRVHSSGDFFSAEYAEKWLEIMRRCKAKFYWYSRSHAVIAIADVFKQMAKLKNVRGWYSIDKDTSSPPEVPPGIRLAFLQTDAKEPVPKSDLVFRIRKLRRLSLPISTACPNERPEGKLAGITCGSCSKCFR